MKKRIRIVTDVAAANLVLFWIVHGILVATWPRVGLSSILGFSPSPALPLWRAGLIWVYVVLGAPTSIILDGTGGDDFILLLALASVLNCMIWGLCLGSLIYAVTKRWCSRLA